MILTSRIWDKKQKKMIYDFFIDCDGVVFKRQPNYYALQPQDIEVMYGIGRKDKSGKELIEGDVVKWVNNYGVENIGWIRYTKSIAGFYVVLIKGSYIPFYIGDERNFGWSDLRIIGNRYENTELLG